MKMEETIQSIKEIARIIYAESDVCNVEVAENNATHIYNAGYRKENTRYMLRADGSFEMIPTVESVRQDVAREIFEEIRKELKLAIDNNYKVRKEHIERYNIINDDIVLVCDGKILALRGMYDFIAELKKKYIGE